MLSVYNQYDGFLYEMRPFKPDNVTDTLRDEYQDYCELYQEFRDLASQHRRRHVRELSSDMSRAFAIPFNENKIVDDDAIDQAEIENIRAERKYRLETCIKALSNHPYVRRRSAYTRVLVTYKDPRNGQIMRRVPIDTVPNYVDLVNGRFQDDEYEDDDGRTANEYEAVLRTMLMLNNK